MMSLMVGGTDKGYRCQVKKTELNRWPQRQLYGRETTAWVFGGFVGNSTYAGGIHADNGVLKWTSDSGSISVRNVSNLDDSPWYDGEVAILNSNEIIAIGGKQSESYVPTMREVFLYNLSYNSWKGQMTQGAIPRPRTEFCLVRGK